MRLKAGTTVMVTLQDGTTLQGRLRRHWRWWSLWLEEVTVYGPAGPQSAAGWFFVPKRSVLFAQVEEAD